jgi:hypothetical protein
MIFDAFTNVVETIETSTNSDTVFMINEILFHVNLCGEIVTLSPRKNTSC